MFANECLGELKYEATTAAIFMAGFFLSFLVDYMGARFMLWRKGREESTAPVEIDTDRSIPTPSDKALPVIGAHAPHIHRTAHIHGSPDEKLSVVVLEAGIIFHSLRTEPDLFLDFVNYL
jgi:zinc transporter 1/2/3